MAGSTEIVLAAVVLAAAWSDLRTRRIPNGITVAGAALGFLLQSWNNGLQGAFSAAAGAILAFAVFVVLYLAGGMGAGDVKLFTAVGALAGPQALGVVFVFTGLLGGVAAIALAAGRGRLWEALSRTARLGGLLSRARWRQVQLMTAAAGPRALRLPYGAVIAGGTLVSLVVL